MINEHANELIEFGEPRGFPLRTRKWTAERIKELDIARCLLCGSRLRDERSNVCGPCLHRQGSVVADKE